MPNFSILLAPSEGKQDGGNPFAPDMFDYRSSDTFNYFNELNTERRSLIDALQDFIQEADEDALQDLFGVKGDHLEEALEVNLNIYDAPLMSALDRYSPGVMYAAMDFPGLPTGAQRRLLENGIIISGLFGLLRPDDLIPNYRLRIDAKLPDVGKIAKYWKPLISPLLNEAVSGKFVWDLLPHAHRAAWEDEQTYEQIVQVKFYDVKDGERKPVTHNVKTLRGELVNFIVRETLEDLEPLHEWTHPSGYVFDPDATEIDEETKSGTVVMVKS
jgi:hypothetical protein